MLARMSTRGSFRPLVTLADFIALPIAVGCAATFHEYYTWPWAVVFAVAGALLSMISLPGLLESLEYDWKTRLLVETIGRLYSSFVMASLLFLVVIPLCICAILGGLMSLTSVSTLFELSTLVGATLGFGFPMFGLRLRRLALFACLLLFSR